MLSIFEIFPDAPPVQIVDVGAMSLGAGTESYAALLTGGRARVCGFEPVQSECDRLNRMHGATHRFLPYVLGDGEERTFHLTNFTATSSLYEPNTALLARFQNLENLTRTVKAERVRTLRLDDLDELPDSVDYVKIDVQGAELDIFRNGARVLEQAVLVHTEVSFLPLYVDQPLFADVDTELRSRGFAFHRFVEFGGRPLRPLVRDGDPNQPISQQLWADALYVRDLMRLDALPAAKLRALAIILHEVYGSVDFCHHVLEALDRVAGGDAARRYLGLLTGAR